MDLTFLAFLAVMVVFYVLGAWVGYDAGWHEAKRVYDRGNNR